MSGRDEGRSDVWVTSVSIEKGELDDVSERSEETECGSESTEFADGVDSREDVPVCLWS